MMKKNAWKIWDEKEKEKAFNFAQEYIKFLSENKTERKFVAAAVNIAREKGFVELQQLDRISSGDRIYKINKD